MMVSSPFNKRRHSHTRMSVGSSMSFASLIDHENLFHGDELVDVFQFNATTAIAEDDAESMPSVPPMKLVDAAANCKRPSIVIIGNLEDAGIFDFDADVSEAFEPRPIMSTSTNEVRRLSGLSSTGSNMRRMSSLSNGSSMILEYMPPSSNTMDLSVGNIFEEESVIKTEEIPSAVPSTVPSAFPSAVPSDNVNFNHNVHNTQTNAIEILDDEDAEVHEIIHELRPYDIVCGRHNGAYNWVGNRRFRITIMMNLHKYKNAPTRDEKAEVISSIIRLVQDTEGANARFLKKVEGRDHTYVRLSNKQIREKVGHSFRDMMNLSGQQQQASAPDAAPSSTM